MLWQQDLLQKVLESWCCTERYSPDLTHGKHSKFRYVSSLQQLSQGMVTECVGLSGHSYWHTQEERPSSVHVSGGEEMVTYSYHYAILPKYVCMCMYVCECMYTLPIHPYMYAVCMYV